MLKRNKTHTSMKRDTNTFKRIQASYDVGLTTQQVKDRIQEGLTNLPVDTNFKSIPDSEMRDLSVTYYGGSTSNSMVFKNCIGITSLFIIMTTILN